MNNKENYVPQMRAWYIVAFAPERGTDDEKEISPIPSIWYHRNRDEEFCFWPVYNDKLRVNRAIARCEIPGTDWIVHKLEKVYWGKIANTYEEAQELADIAVETSDLEKGYNASLVSDRKKKLPNEFGDYIRNIKKEKSVNRNKEIASSNGESFDYDLPQVLVDIEKQSQGKNYYLNHESHGDNGGKTESPPLVKTSKRSGVLTTISQPNYDSMDKSITNHQRSETSRSSNHHDIGKQPLEIVEENSEEKCKSSSRKEEHQRTKSSSTFNDDDMTNQPLSIENNKENYKSLSRKGKAKSPSLIKSSRQKEVPSTSSHPDNQFVENNITKKSKTTVYKSMDELKKMSDAEVMRYNAYLTQKLYAHALTKDVNEGRAAKNASPDKDSFDSDILKLKSLLPFKDKPTFDKANKMIAETRGLHSILVKYMKLHKVKGMSGPAHVRKILNSCISNEVGRQYSGKAQKGTKLPFNRTAFYVLMESICIDPANKFSDNQVFRVVSDWLKARTEAWKKEVERKRKAADGSKNKNNDLDDGDDGSNDDNDGDDGDDDDDDC